MSEPTGRHHSDDEYLEAVREHEPVTTSDVAEVVGVSRQGADYRLRRLEAAGLVEREVVGNSLVWRSSTALRPVDPTDDFWTAEAYAGEPLSAAAIDDVVYADEPTG